jgi:hypothetical protein
MPEGVGSGKQDAEGSSHAVTLPSVQFPQSGMVGQSIATADPEDLPTALEYATMPLWRSGENQSRKAAR